MDGGGNWASGFEIKLCMWLGIWFGIALELGITPDMRDGHATGTGHKAFNDSMIRKNISMLISRTNL